MKTEAKMDWLTRATLAMVKPFILEYAPSSLAAVFIRPCLPTNSKNSQTRSNQVKPCFFEPPSGRILTLFLNWCANGRLESRPSPQTRMSAPRRGAGFPACGFRELSSSLLRTVSGRTRPPLAHRWFCFRSDKSTDNFTNNDNASSHSF
jgi:hypothetical protein